MGKYTELAAAIIKNVGGKENVNDLRHCVTRLRFRLADESKANDDVLKNMDGVMTVVKAMGEYMVVIGEHVADVYDEVCLQLGRPGEKSSAPAAAAEPEKKKSLLDRALGVIRAGMGPTLNLMCACGIIKGITVVAAMLGLASDSGIYMMLNAAGDCIFYSLPLVLGFNVAKKNNIDPFFGLLLGAAMTYPTIQGVDLNFFGYTVNATYTSTFLPVLFGLMFAIPLYKWLDAHIHKLLKGFLTPMIALLIAFPLTFIIIGPVAQVVASGINIAINFIFNLSPLIGGMVVGALWQVLVMFGVHGQLVAFAFYDLLAGNPSALMAVTMVISFAVCGTLLAVTLRSKSQQLKSVSGSALVSAIFGITEPAMYGVIIPRKQIFAATCIGGAAAGLVCGIFGLKLYTYAGMGIIGMLGYLNPTGPNHILGLALAVIAPFVVAFLISMAIFKDDDDTPAGGDKAPETKTENKANAITIQAPVDGTVRSMTSSSDEVFASETLGKGCLILPDNGNVYAPVNGTVCSLFPTKHAIGLISEDGVEILLHIGINTVSLEGKYFKEKVKQGDSVKAGQLLLSFDKDAIEKEGYSTEIPVVITNCKEYLDVVELDHEHHTHGDDIVKIIQ